MKKSILVLFFSYLFIYSLFADGTISVNPVGTATQASSMSVRDWSKGVSGTLVLSSQTAMATAGYPVTPGDIYTLGMVVDGSMVSYSLVVDTSYKLKVLNLAVLDVTGKTYSEVKSQVESVMGKNYPMQGSVFYLSSPGVFKVLVKGEVTQTMELNAWGLSRLSQTISSVITDYSSIRDITVTSANGKSKSYDLFQAIRYGDLSQDPYLKTGDSITISRVKRTVTLAGAVERPGVYQLLDGEELSDLVKKYGNGFTPLADSGRIQLVRYLESGDPAGKKIVLADKDVKDNYALANFDYITVGSTTDLLPTMFIEGAISVAAGATTQASVRKPVQFTPGENYASLVRSNRSLFSAISDTSNAYIMRGDKTIALDLNPMMYDANFMSEHSVENNDLLVIPFRQYFVTVTGGVNAPGRYPYIPNRDWNYYIGLAGGFVKEYNTASMVKITDVTGKKLKKSDVITPETSIEAAKNSFLYYFNLYSPVITTTLAVVVSFYTVKDIIATH